MGRRKLGRKKVTLYLKPETEQEVVRQKVAVEQRTQKPFTLGGVIDAKFKRGKKAA